MPSRKFIIFQHQHHLQTSIRWLCDSRIKGTHKKLKINATPKKIG
jgi:hypothetical protein